MLVDVVGILARFVVIAESLYLHAVQTILLVNDEVEITHEIGGEIILRHLEEQLVLVYRIGNVGEHEDERLVALDAEYLGFGFDIIIEYSVAARPYIAQVECAALELSAGFHSVENHSCHLAESAVRIFLYHLLHIIETCLDITLVELGESADKEELVAVGSFRIALVRDSPVVYHLII